MRLVLFQILILLLSFSGCHSETCDGTCVAMNSIGNHLDATCTKSADCLILSCQTPRKARKYGAVAKPRIQIYPCEDPVVLNLQVHGSFLGSTFTENRNFTGDTDYSKTVSILGIHQTVDLHVRLTSYDRKIRFKLSASYGSNTYTLIPATDIPLDKSGCEGVSSTTQNPLCIVATTHTTITTIQTTTGPTGTTTGHTSTTTGHTGTTTGHTGTTTGHTGTTTGHTGTTTGHTGTTTGHTGTTTGHTGTTTGHTGTTTGHTGTTTGHTGTTTGHTGTTTGHTGTTTGHTGTTTGHTGTTTGHTGTTTGPAGTTTGHTGTTTGHTGTTTGHTGTTTGHAGTTTGYTGTTTGHTGTTTGHTGTTTGYTGTTTGHTGTTTEPTGTTTGYAGNTTGHTGTTTGPVVINQNSQSNKVSGGAIGGIVATVCILFLVSVAIATSLVLLIAYRRKAVRYSTLKDGSMEM